MPGPPRRGDRGRQGLEGHLAGRIQDPGEPGIPGVVLVIERTDGKPVTDVDGNPVGSETTDGNGEFSFEEATSSLPGVEYVVKIDREASSRRWVI